MKIRNVNMIMMLLAGIIVNIFALIYDYSLQRLVYTVIIVLVIFFIIGSLVQLVINRINASVEKNERTKEEEELKKQEQDVKEVLKEAYDEEAIEEMDKQIEESLNSADRPEED